MKAGILVVDDEKSIRVTFQSFLEEKGYDVSVAKDYDQAVQWLDQRPFDLLYVDILLGGRTGIELLQNVKQRSLNCPVVMITGAPHLDTASEALRLGAFDYIPKPVEKETLLRVTSLALHHKSVVDEREKYRTNLDAIFRSVDDPIITVDHDLMVVEMNHAAEDFCGRSRTDVIGNSFGALPSVCNGKGLEILKRTIRTRAPEEVFRTECHHVGRPTQVVTLTTSPLLDRQGRFLGAVLVIRDETRLDDLERGLRERCRFHHMIGQNEKMQKIYSLIEDLADVQTTVLISGESGTGKELVAEAVHYCGARSSRPLVKVNCSALPESLLESELFGHVKGAFTGAIKDKLGRFQRADGGTIFLDEIGDISPAIQLRLLRVLQETEFERVGDSSPIRVDVRVVAATNRDLQKKVRLGEFREDLYYRLKVVEVMLPPLRERRDDIPVLIEHYLKKLNKKFHKEISAISKEVQEMFMDHAWPGNVRELAHTLEHAFVISHQNTITVDHLPANFLDHIEKDRSDTSGQRISGPEAILHALKEAKGNKSMAAERLGVSRMTLYRKMEEFGIAEQTKKAKNFSREQ